MTKVKTFFGVLQKSFLPNHAYYPHILRAPFSFSLKYFISLIIFVNFIFVTALLPTINPNNLLVLKNSLQKSFSEYPPSLVIDIANGRMYSNADKPYFWWLDYKDKKMLLAVVDDTASPEKIYTYNSYVLLTGEALVFNTKKLAFARQVKPYRKNAHFDKTAATALGTTVDAKLQLFYDFFIPIVFVSAPLIFSVFFLFYLFLLSLVAHPLYLLFFRKPAYFLKTFQIALHAATVPIIVYYSVHYFRVSGEAIPLMPLVFANLVIIFIVGGLHEAYFSSKKLAK